MNLVSLIYTTLVVLQTLLVLTGGAVRLTGSGLGCPTWPDCVGGSLAPVPHQAQGTLHSWIEFGNRLLTVLLILAIFAAIVGAFRWGRARADWAMIRNLAIIQFLGIVAQIVLGGITVLTKLNPFSVSSHFLLSILLIGASASLRQRMVNSPRINVLPTTLWLIRALLVLSGIVIMLGTVVTGSGPHAGDIQAKRYHIDPRLISWMHADAVIALITLTIGLILVVRVSETVTNRALVGKQAMLFLSICLGQGLIGYIQYFTHLPEGLVALHLLGAACIWLAMWNIAFTSHALSRTTLSTH